VRGQAIREQRADRVQGRRWGRIRDEPHEARADVTNLSSTHKPQVAP
jgi:hypothetical protein